MAKVLITGGAGFIGSNYAYYRSQHHPDDLIVVLDALTYAGCRATLDPLIAADKLKFVHGSINDAALLDDLMKRYAFDLIVHFAAESHVDRSISGPDAFIETNIVGTYTLLKSALKAWRKTGMGHFHHISTDEVYGSLKPDDPPFCEENPFRPNSPYSASKASSDCLVRAFVHTYGLKATVTNCSNNYGPRQFPEKLIPLSIINLLTGKTVPVYGDGKQIRDWLYVEDHCKAIDLAVSRGQSGAVYNIGGRAEKTNLEIIAAVCREIDEAFALHPDLAARYPKAAPARGHACRDMIVHVTDRPGHDRRYAIDPRFVEHSLGFKPDHSFEQGIHATVAWYLEHEEWWRALQARVVDFSKR